MSSPRLGSALLAAALVWGGADVCWGTLRTWDGGGVTNNWSEAANWSSDTAPIAGDEVVFNGTSGKNCTVDSAPASLSTFTVGAYTGVITFAVDGVTNQDLTIAETFSLGGGTVVFAGKTGVSPYGLGWTLRAKNLTVGLTTVMHADGQGFAALNGPGQGTTGLGASGSGHGGKGGAGSTNAIVGETYGAAASPQSLGSGSVRVEGGAGGGAIKLVVTGTATVNGRLSADGDSSAAVCGASGGSIWILGGGKLTGTGIIRAAGGSANASHGGGGGGRIDVSSVTYAFTGALSAPGGAGFANGQAGTVSPEPAAVTNLAVTALVSTGLGASSMTVTLTWTSPGEDGTTGTLNGSYDLRWSTTAPITSTTAYFGASFQLLLATTAAPGSLQGTSIQFLNVAASHYFALTVIDSSGTRSGLSNPATAQAYIRGFGDANGLAEGLAVGDLNGDGRPDILQARFNGGVRQWRNAGGMSFSDVGAVAGTFNEANAVSLADLDRNGSLDAVVANTNGQPAQALRNDGTGTFTVQASTAAGLNTYGVAAGDYNGDGRPDFAAANYSNQDDYAARANADGTFSTATLTGSGKNSLSVAWTDYDLDGYLDLAIANDSGQDETIVHNNGNGTFSTFTLTGSGGNSTSVAWGDYDGDGYPDLAVGNSGADAMLARNNGNGTFTIVAPNPFAGFGGNTTSLSWGDYNGDGRADLLVTDSSGQDSIYRNDGGGTFTKVLLPGTAGNSRSGAWADLDGDGDLDAAVSTRSSTQLFVLRNDAALALSSPTAVSAGFSSSWAEDSLFAASGTLTLRWSAASDDTTPAADLLYWVRVGTTTGGSELQRVPPVNSERGRSRLYPDHLSAAQPGLRITGVAKGAAAYWAVAAEDAGYLRGPASAEQTVSLVAPRNLTDLAVFSIVSTGLGASTMSVTLTWTAPGDDGASGAFSGSYDVRWATFPVSSTGAYALAPFSQSFATASVAPGARQWQTLTGLAVASTWYFALTSKDAVGVRSDLSVAATAQAYVRSFGSSGNGVGIAAGDMDGDGAVDLVQALSNGGVHFWRNSGGLAFTDTGRVAGTFNEAKSVSLADLDRSGSLDVVVGNTGGQPVQALRNDGAGTFTIQTTTASGLNTYGVAAGDFNGDGRPDFAAANYSNLDEYAARANADGTFSTTTLLASGKNSLSVAWADYDLDGYLDLAIANDTAQDEVIAHNNGNGTFSTFTLTGTGGNSAAVAWGDYDGDGYPDLAIGNTGDAVLERNNGNGTFSIVIPNPFSGFGGNTTSLSWGDYNGDGRPDLLVTDSVGQSSIYRNEGGGVFTKVLLPGTLGDTESGVWADLDGDGDLDVALSTNNSTQLVVLRNDAARTLSSPTAVSAGLSASWAEDSVAAGSGTLTLKWNAATDDTTPAADLLYWVRVGTNTGGSEYQRVPPVNSERGRSRLYPDHLSPAQLGLRLTGVPKGGPVYWAVTAEDNGYLRGSASAEQTADLTPPSAVTLSAAQDATVETSSVAWVSLTFNAPGENGASGDLQTGAVYDVRWTSAGALDTLVKYASAPYQTTFAAQGTAGAATALRVGVDPGKTWFFALTTKDSLGSRSGVSNSPSVYARLVRERVDDAAPFNILQGPTTSFLRVKLWTEGAATTADLLKVKVKKFGTLPDASISNVGLYLDDGDGVFTAADELSLLTSPAVFSSSQATLILPAPLTLNTSTQTFFVAATIKPDFLPVPGASVSLRLDGEAVAVRGAGVEQADFPALELDGIDDRLTVPFTAALDLGGGGGTAGTLEAWLRSTDTARTSASVISRHGAATGYRLWLGGPGCSPGVPSFFVGTSVLCAANGAGQVSVTDGRWHHVAAVFNAGAGSMFLDGVALATGTMGGTLADAASDLAVGGPNPTGGAYFLGELDEVRISNFVRYPAELPPVKRHAGSGSVVLYHFDGVAETTAKDASPNGIDGALQGQARGYARSTGTAVADVPDVVFSSAAPLLPAALFRNDQNDPVMRLQLWTTGDFALLDQLTLTATGSAVISSVNQVKLYLDDGDGLFNPALDTALTVGQSFSGGKATFSLLGAGNEQVISPSTKTFFVAWNVSGSASNNADIGVVLASTADLVLAGAVDQVSPAAFPLKSGTAPIVAAQALIPAETSTGTWVNVSSIVFQGTFNSGNVNHFHWRWDQSTGTAVTGAESPVWIAGKTTVTATSDNSNWYFHARAFDTFDLPGTQLDFGPFWVDRAAPTGSLFADFNSTGGAISELQYNDLASGVTAQLTVQDQAGLSGLSLSGPAPHAPSSGTVGLWHFDEPTGNWSDSGSVGNLLSPAGSAGRGPGRFDGAVLLDGVSAATRTAPILLPTGNAARTLEAWVNLASTQGTQGLIGWGAGGCSSAQRFEVSGQRLGVDFGCASAFFGPALSTGVWHHAAMTWDGAAARLYLDGVRIGTQAFGVQATAAGTLWLGSNDAGNGMRGLLDEARILDRAMSDAEVALSAQRGDPYYASVSTDAGRAWRVVTATDPAAGTYVALTGAHGTTAPQTMSLYGLQLVVSTNTGTGGAATDQVRFHFSDVAGNVRTAGPFGIQVDTNAPVAYSTPTLPGTGRYAGLKPDFFWAGPATGAVQGLGGTFVLQVSSGDPAFAPASIAISVSTPALVADQAASRVTGFYISTFTLSEGATYYWRVRSRSSLGVLGPFGPVSSFVTDAASPTVSGFKVYNSTGGAFGQAGPIDLLGGVTVQVTVADALAGLSQAVDVSTLPGTLAYWRFTERHGAAAFDEAAGLTGTFNCTGGGCQPPRYALTPFGVGLHFSGAQYLSASNASFQFPASSTFTVSAWIKPTVITGVNQVVAALGGPLTPSKGANWVFWVNNTGALRLTNVTTGGAQTPSGLVAAGVWSHVAVVCEGTQARFYVNGALKHSQSWTGISGGGVMPFSIGAGVRDDAGVEGQFTGDIDEVRVLSYASDSAEVAAEFSRAAPGRYAVEYSTTAGSAWIAVSATSPAAGYPWVALSGPDGSLASETLTVRDLRLAQSTTTAVGGAATNQVRVLAMDRRGNYTLAGPFAVVVDTVAAAAVSTPTLPSPGVFVSTRPNFAWDGPSTATAMGLGATAQFLLEVDDDPLFSAPEIAVTTPIVVTATGALFTQGVYLSTIALAHGTTYYWRVRALDYLGLYSNALTTFSFVTDFSSPTGGAFLSYNSTGGATGESTGLNLASGVTVQVTIQDTGPGGLALGGPVTPYGVMYTTQGAAAFPVWIDGAWGDAIADAGQGSFRALKRFGTSLYGGTAGGKVWGYDGASWALSASLGAGVYGLESFNGRLYAGLAGNGQVQQFDGIAWSLQATLAPGVDVRALKAYAGRLYAGDSAGRVWGYDAGLGSWFVAYQSTSAVIESLEVYDGRLYAAGNPNIFAFDGTSWNVTLNVSAAIPAMKVYDGKLYAATTNQGTVYQFDGVSWNTVLIGGGSFTQATSLGVHAGRLYAGLDLPSPGRLEAFDGKSWVIVRQFQNANDRSLALSSYGGRLYAGLNLVSGDALVQVSTPLAVSLTGSEGDTAAQTMTGTGLNLAQSAAGTVCAGNPGCTATNQVRFSFTDRAGRAGQAGPFAMLVDSLLSQPTTYAPSGFIRTVQPDYAWLESSTMPTHVVQLSTSATFATQTFGLNTGAAPFSPVIPLSNGVTYYWHLTALNAFGVASSVSDPASFVVDAVAPSSAAYQHQNSTGGVLAESQLTNLASGATVTLTVQDPLSGLALTPLASDLRVGAWSFEESTMTAFDLSGRGANGTLGALALRTANGYRGAGLAFPNAAFAVNVATTSGLSWTGVTVMGWAKTAGNTAATKTLFATASDKVYYQGAQGRVRYGVLGNAAGGCSTTTAQSFPLGAWTHVAFVADPVANQNRLFVDGQLAASCSGAATPADTPLRFGTDGLTGLGSTDAFDGTLDEVRAFHAPLSQAGVQRELAGAPFAVLFSTDAGASWAAVASTGPFGPRLSFSGASGSTAPEAVKVVDLPLRESTSAAVCAQAFPCAATNQLLFYTADRAGMLRQSGPFAVVVDTSVAAPTLTSLAPAATDQLYMTAASTTDLSGIRDFLYEASTSASFAAPLSSSGFVASSTYTLGGLLNATTYFVRVWARDQLLNVSTPSVSLATATFGSVFVTTQAALPSGALQGALVPMVTLRLATKAGAASRLLSLKVRKTGTTLDSDVDQVQLYSDADGDGVFTAGDTLQAFATLSANEALLTLAGAGAPLDVHQSTFHVVFKMNSGADTTRTVGVELSSVTSVSLAHPARAEGPFPVAAGPASVSDGANSLQVGPVSLAPGSAQPGTDDIPMLQLGAVTDIGTSVISSMVFTLSGTLPSANIRSINVWRDADPPDGVFDRNADVRLTPDTDNFGPLSVATVSLVGFDISSRTVTTASRRFFVTVSLAANAPQDTAFRLAVATTAGVVLRNPLDTVVFSTAVITSTLSVVLNNTLAVSAVDETPAAFVQGDRFAVLRVTMTVDAGAASVNQFKVRLTGNGAASNVSAVEVWRDAALDGKSLSPILDTRVGSAPFVGALATVDVTTQTILAGTSSAFFIAYVIAPAATPGVTLGAQMKPGDVRAGNAGTTVSMLQLDSSTRAVQATVNHMLIVNAIRDVSPGSLLQGQQHAAMLRLDAASDKNSFPWLGLSVERLGTAPDAAVSAVDVYRDFDGNGLFDAAVDSRITSGSDVFTSSAATLSLTETQTVAAAPKTYFVVLSVSPSATPGQTLGVRIATGTSFNLLAPNTVSTATAFPIATGLVPVNQFQNTITVSTASIVPVLGAEPGASAIGLMALSLRTDVSNANWTGLRVDQAGTAADADIAQVQLYYDFNDSGQFDSSNLTLYSTITVAGQTFGQNGAGSVNLAFSTPQVLGTVPKRYFLVVDLSTAATPARTVVVRASTGAFFAVEAPNTVDPAASFTSQALNINAPPVTMFVTAADSAPATVTQGSPNMPMLTLRARSGAFQTRWTQLRVTRTGSGTDGDVTAVKLYRDADGDGRLNIASDERLSTGVFSGGTALLSFATQTVAVATQTFFVTYDLKTTAGAGGTVGARIAAAGDFKVDAPNTVGTAGFPLQSGNSAVVATQAGLSVSGTNLAPGELKQGATDQVLLSLSLQTTQFALTWSALTVKATGTATDSDIRAVSVWVDANFNGVVDVGTDTKITSGLNAFLSGTAVLSLSQLQEIGTASRRYLLTADVAPFAEPGRTFGVVLASTAAFAVSSPNSVVNSNFPIQSDANATLRKLEEQLVVTPADLVGSGINQGSNTALARLSARATRNKAGWTALSVRQNGNLSAGEITAVRLFRDTDGSGALSAADLLVGSAAFVGSQAQVSFSSAQTVGVAIQTYFLAVEPALNATVGADIRLSLQAGDFTITAPDAVSASNLPFNTGAAVVLDAKTPSQPVVSDDGAFSSDFEGLNFKWSSSVGTGSVTGAFYAVGTAPGGTDVRPYTAIPAALTTVRAVGFPLLQGTTYYVSVKAQSSFGFDSPVGVTDGLLMDFSVPVKPAPTVTTGSGALLVTWATVPSGPSGILGYLVEYRTGASPVWFNAKTGAKTGVTALELPGAAAFTAKGAAEGAARTLAVSTDALVTGGSFQATSLPTGTLFVRVRAMTGSGVLSPAPDPVKVQLGPLPADGLSDASVYPNPFDSRKGPANVTYVLSQPSDVTMKVYSVFGRLVREASLSGGQVGSNTAQWDGSDDSGRKVSKGLYIMVLSAGGAKATVKVGVIH